MKVIYVAGPYRAKTEIELENNIKAAEEVALILWLKGWAVICPHKNTAHFGGAAPDDVWLAGNLELLRRCDAIYMMKGWKWSEGAVAEYKFAKALNIKIVEEA